MSVHFSPFDVIRFPSGINREITEGVVLDMHEYETGDVSMRWRYASNRHRGVDWSGFIRASDVPGVVVIERDETVSGAVHSMLPGA